MRTVKFIVSTNHSRELGVEEIGISFAIDLSL